MPTTTEALENQLKLFDAAVRSAASNWREHVALICQERLGSKLFDRALSTLSELERSQAKVKQYPPNSLRVRAARLGSGSLIFHGLLETRSLLEVPPIRHIFLEMPANLDQLTFLMSEAGNVTSDAGSIILMDSQILGYVTKGTPTVAGAPLRSSQ